MLRSPNLPFFNSNLSLHGLMYPLFIGHLLCVEYCAEAVRVSKSEQGPVFRLPTVHEVMATNLRRPESRWLHPADCGSDRSSLSPGSPSGRITSFLWWAPLYLPFPMPGLQGTGVMQFKALSHMGKLNSRAAMLGLTPCNQGIRDPPRTIPWI